MSVITYKCPNCGAYIEYNSTEDKFQCGYCSSVFTLDEVKNYEVNSLESPYEEGIKENIESEADQTFRAQTYKYCCEQCGAEIITDENTASTFCLYCHNPNIIKERLTDGFSPELIIPFKIKKQEAIDILVKMTSKKWFAPNDFGSKEQQEKISGLYVPYWLFDERSHFDIDAHGYRVKTWRSGDIEYTQTDTYAIRREGYMDFEKVPVDASKKLDNHMLDMIEPYDYGQLKGFEIAYLSGYYTDKYDQNQQDVYPKVKEKIKKNTIAITNGLINGYTRTKVFRSDIAFENLKVHYSLFPVWFLTYKYQNKDYYFTMNGQTGKIYGNIPRSNQKAFKFFGILSLVIYLALIIALVVNPI